MILMIEAWENEYIAAFVQYMNFYVIEKEESNEESEMISEENNCLGITENS